jgi:hypothetical protein
LIHVVFALLGFGMNEITAERLRELLNYDPATGQFTWLVKPSPRIRVGGVAGHERPDGYRQIGLDRRLYLTHRLVWLYMTGEWPLDQIDHINGDRADNRWLNLRPATCSQNKANSGAARNNTSGFKGVSWHSRWLKWRTNITVNGRQRSLGYFDCPAEAHEAYVRAAEKHFGKFARSE